MREIEFRGRRLYNGEWVYGIAVQLMLDNKEPYTAILSDGEFATYDGQPYFKKFYFVEGNTVGQYTGLRDKHGKKIYEGDICRLAIRGLGEETVTIIWNNGFWIENPVEGLLPLRDFVESDNMEIDVIGNIHDNPELLEKEEK